MSRKNLLKLTPYEAFPALIKWLANNLTKSNYKDTSYALRIVDKILTILKTRGKPEAIRYCKELRLNYLKFILSINKDFKIENKLWLPKILRPITNHILMSKSYPFIRLIFSSLYITRCLRLEGDISTDTIEKGPGYTRMPSSLRPEIHLFLKDLGVNPRHFGKVPKSLRFKEFHMTSKSGPNGHALWTSFKDIMSLSNLQLYSIKIIGGEKLSSLISKFIQLYKQIPSFFDSRCSRKEALVSRRLTKIVDKEGKIREVAIGDYYSQAALLPLHNFLLKQLSKINQDCTQDQTKNFYSIETSIGNSYHSIDLTAFTDRFPIDINREIIDVWFGSEYAHCWKHLMVGDPFDYKGRNVSYGTGNPMGLYSSWASTTLAHHFLMWLACKRVNLNWRRSRYMMLGDDIVIGNDRLSSSYKDILSEWDIDFNKTKTHTSDYGFEFAKQIRLHDQNVSPFPLSALYERRSETITSLGIILSEIQYKRWNSDLMSVLKNYYIRVLGWERPKYRSFQPTLELVISLIRYLQGKEILGKAIMSYVVSLTNKKIKWTNKAHKRLFTHYVAVKVIQNLYLDSRERIVSPSTKGSLGDLATLMVMNITSLRDGGADCFDLIESVPFLQVYGRAEEIFLKTYDNLYDYGMGSSNELLRSHIGKVDIPLSDEGFYVRHRDVLVVQAMKASKIITNLLKTTTKVDAYNGQLRFELPWSQDLIAKFPHLDSPNT
jgi:hypothetical protein